MKTDTEVTSNIVRLVLGVARLGENDLRGWWQGHAIDRTGQYVLAGMFRRTWRPAAMQLDVAAATLMHNQLLGRSTALHMFSELLPFGRWTTSWLAEQKTAAELDPLLGVLEGWSAHDSSDALRAWCRGLEPERGDPVGDGLLLGRLSSDEIADPSILHQIACRLVAAYLNQTGPLRPPYFDLAR